MSCQPSDDGCTLKLSPLKPLATMRAYKLPAKVRTRRGRAHRVPASQIEGGNKTRVRFPPPPSQSVGTGEGVRVLQDEDCVGAEDPTACSTGSRTSPRVLRSASSGFSALVSGCPPSAPAVGRADPSIKQEVLRGVRAIRVTPDRNKLHLTLVHILAHLRRAHGTTMSARRGRELALRGFAATLKGIRSQLDFSENDSGEVAAATSDAKRADLYLRRGANWLRAAGQALGISDSASSTDTDGVAVTAKCHWGARAQQAGIFPWFDPRCAHPNRVRMEMRSATVRHVRLPWSGVANAWHREDVIRCWRSA